MKKILFTKSQSMPLKSVTIDDEFWLKRLELNNSTAIFYQWEQLEKTHNQDNFRILAGEKEGYRFGFFYCDSDLHKWSDAAARILVTNKNVKLSKLVKEYIDLMSKTQTSDGYLFTYNQFHFPKQRWTNLQIEHELYCLGHLIEAAVSYYDTDEPMKYRTKFLEIATKAADLLVNYFKNTPPRFTPGHQEIEIALIKLYRLTQNKTYLDLASEFISKRGKVAFFGLQLLRQASNQNKRTKIIQKDMERKNIDDSFRMRFFEGETKQQKEAPFLSLRSTFQFLSGRYHQQNSPVKKMKRPFGHSVRWGYLATAMAMLYQENGDEEILKALVRTWENLVDRHLFITGGIGALGIVEGFGREYELDSSYCYCETCAAIANILLNWEMALITGEAKYSDLLEWQLYNALSVGIALDGQSYLYRNLLQSNKNLKRDEWFATPCCPSNISRIWASVGEYIYSFNEKNIWIHQYIGNKTKLNVDKQDVKLEIDSKFPWDGKVRIKLECKIQHKFTINLRIPSWTKNPEMKINDRIHRLAVKQPKSVVTGSGFSPHSSVFYPINRKWEKENIIEINFPMKITKHKAHTKVKSNRGKIALSRGPLVYCFESIDNPEIPIPEGAVDLSQELTSQYEKELFDGIFTITAKSKMKKNLIAIPYYCWANRKLSSMQVWIRKQ